MNVVDVAVAGTVTDAGAVKVEFEFVMATLAPPLGAALVSITVQIVDEFGPRLLGLQATEETSTEAERLMVVLAALPLYVAVRIAL